MKRKISISAILAVSFFLLTLTASSQVLNEGTFKIGRTFGLIDAFYVDSADMEMLTEKAIIEILKNLDPHSTYISAKDVKDMNEPLNGNFEGIGVQFNLLRDSIIIIEPIAGGPSEKVGVRAGDRILTIISGIIYNRDLRFEPDLLPVTGQRFHDTPCFRCSRKGV